jgi:hypothetical protein
VFMRIHVGSSKWGFHCSSFRPTTVCSRSIPLMVWQKSLRAGFGANP